MNKDDATREELSLLSDAEAEAAETCADVTRALGYPPHPMADVDPLSAVCQLTRDLAQILILQRETAFPPSGGSSARPKSSCPTYQVSDNAGRGLIYDADEWDAADYQGKTFEQVAFSSDVATWCMGAIAVGLFAAVLWWIVSTATGGAS